MSVVDQPNQPDQPDTADPSATAGSRDAPYAVAPDHTRHLPVRPTPLRVEALHSYVIRIAAANHLSITELLGYLPRPTAWRTGEPRLLETVGRLTGQPGEVLRHMTFASYDIAPGGALQGFAGLRPLNQLAVCHHCYARDGIRLRDWDHALCVICRDCNRLLEPLKETHPQMRRVRGQTQLHLEFVMTELDWSKDSHYARENFRLMRSLAAPIVRGISPTWPRFADPVLKDWHHRAWTELERYPGKRDGRPASPYVATVALMHAWHKAVIGADRDLVRRLERRFPAPKKPTPMSRFR